MSIQSGTWFWRLWRKIALWSKRRSSHTQLTSPALYSVPRAPETPSTRKLSAMQWRLNDHSSNTTDHIRGVAEVEVELITDPLNNFLPDETIPSITHFPSDRLH